MSEINRDVAWAIEVRHEILGMNTGIGSSAAHCFDGCVADLAQRLIDVSLNGGCVGLGLPSAEMGAIIGQFHSISHLTNFRK